MSSTAYHFKIAADPAERAQIHRLNYRTFVDEIPQHTPNGDGVLVDRFDDENVYAVCLRDDRVVGMICVRETRPFSLDQKLGGVDAYLPPGRSPCEIRLLAVEPGHRTGVVFRGLVECLTGYCLARGHDLAVISGTERQLKLYGHIGFVAFGPTVGTAAAPYQPMYLDLDTFRARGLAFVRPPASGGVVGFLPGPVEVADAVRQAMAAPAVSHRDAGYAAAAARVRAALRALTGARRVQLLLGSGTAANEVVAAQLSLLGGPGVVLSNGEFGERLADHASRWRLEHTQLRAGWGSAIPLAAVEAALDGAPRARWLWCVHCETSTGVLNDLPALAALCAGRGVRLCVDAISSLGTVPVDLRGVHLATGVGGKGLGSLAGLGLVFHHHRVAPSPALPRYLDLGLYDARDDTPFTQSSNLVAALDAALAQPGDVAARHAALRADAAWLRHALRAAGFRTVADDDVASPAVTTLALPAALPAAELGERMQAQGYLLAFRSDYLRARNWLQVCLMGAYRRDHLAPLAAALARAATPAAAAAAGPPASVQ